MEDNKKINNNQAIEKNEEKSYEELLKESTNDWTVEDTMALYPNLTRKEAEIAWRMGW